MTTLVIPPRKGKTVSLGGFGAIFKISGDFSEGRFSIVEHPIDPGRIVHPHVHAHEDEFSYILEGEIGARVGDDSRGRRPGGRPGSGLRDTAQAGL